MGVVASTHWYALNVRANREVSVASCLKQVGVPHYLPMRKRERKHGRHSPDGPLFPGYIFCRVDLNRAPKFYHLPGFIRILGIGKEPALIEDTEIEMVRSLVESSVSIESYSHLSAGDEITVTAGPFTSVPGVVLETRGFKRVVVSLPLLKRAIAVTVPIDWVLPRSDSGG